MQKPQNCCVLMVQACLLGWLRSNTLENNVFHREYSDSEINFTLFGQRFKYFKHLSSLMFADVRCVALAHLVNWFEATQTYTQWYFLQFLNEECHKKNPLLNTHNALFLCSQHDAESVVDDVTSSEGHGCVCLLFPLYGGFLPAVPGVVVLVGEPQHSESSHLPAGSSTPAPPAAGSGWAGLRKQELSSVQEAPHQCHRAVHLGLRVLLPLHLHIREK